MTGPAYTRLGVDERRAQLLELGARVFTEHAYGDVSMADIAREGKVSKPLLYHYFPSKQAFFAATLAGAAEELTALTALDPALAPAEQLIASLDAFLVWIEGHRDGYLKVMQSASSHPEVGDLINAVREPTAQRILDGVTSGAPAPPAVRTAVRAWLWFMDGACIDWLHNRDLSRDELRGLLLGTLFGAVGSAGGQQFLEGLS
jgi:AcrR family transcriptional regulator